MNIMNIKKQQFKLVFLGLSLFLIVFHVGCKKLDLVRVAAVKTDVVEDISDHQAKVYGKIIDLGENETVDDYGFCWAIGKTPTVTDFSSSLGRSSILGNFWYIMTGLINNTTYSVRAYVKEGSSVTYGNTLTFTTDLGLPPPGPRWFNYDDGNNADGIGLTSGGDWDVAMRIPSGDLQQYHGYKISKIKFYAKEGFPIEYSITVWEGSNPPDLVKVQYVPSPNIEAWTEVYLEDNLYVNASIDLWVGYWVQNQPEGSYPAGVDDGPAITGFGDLMSTDDGDTWDALSTFDPPNLDYNWNLQVYVVDSKGNEKQIQINSPIERESVSEFKGGNQNIPISKKQVTKTNR